MSTFIVICTGCGFARNSQNNLCAYCDAKKKIKPGPKPSKILKEEDLITELNFKLTPEAERLLKNVSRN